MRSFLLLLSLAASLLAAPALAQSDPEALRPLINDLAKGKYSETEKQIGALVATGDPQVAPALEALSDGDLYVRKADGESSSQEGRKNFALIDR